MWIWLWPHSEAATLRSVAIGDHVSWACRTSDGLHLPLPAGVDPGALRFEDEDHGSGIPDEQQFLDTRGVVLAIQAAVDDWRVRLEGRLNGWTTTYEPVPDSRTWHRCTSFAEARAIPEPGFSGLLVELAETTSPASEDSRPRAVDPPPSGAG